MCLMRALLTAMLTMTFHTQSRPSRLARNSLTSSSNPPTFLPPPRPMLAFPFPAPPLLLLLPPPPLFSQEPHPASKMKIRPLGSTADDFPRGTPRLDPLQSERGRPLPLHSISALLPCQSHEAREHDLPPSTRGEPFKLMPQARAACLSGFPGVDLPATHLPPSSRAETVETPEKDVLV